MSDDRNRQRLDQAMALGPFALLRLRAEILLGYAERGKFGITLTETQREELHRIAVAPREEDRTYLGGFDHFLAANPD